MNDDQHTPTVVTTTVLSIQQNNRDATLQQHNPDMPAQQQHGKRHQQGSVVNAARRNVYRTNSRRRYDLSPAVRRCVVTDKTLPPPSAAADDVIDDVTDPQQQPTALFSRRHVINLDPLTPRTGVDQPRPGRGNVLPATGTAKVRWQRQQTTYQLTPRALRTARTDASAGARLTTRRQHTMTDENFLSATGKKLLDGSATTRNGETCRVIELKLNGSANGQTMATAVHGNEPSIRPPHQRRVATTAVSLNYTDSTDHHRQDSPATATAAAAPVGGIVLPQLSTHR